MNRHRRDLGSVVFGLGLVAIGALFLADNLDLANVDDYFVYWPAVFILLGLADLARRKLFGAFVWILVGSILLAGTLGYLSVGIWDLWGLWPLVLVGVGLSLIRQSLDVVPKDLATDRGSVFRAGALMGGNVRKVSSTNFLGGDVFVVMAGAEIDLRQVKLNGREAVIDIFAFWGGAEIRVPDDWEVDDRVAQILGGVENKTELPDHPSGKLTVRGSAVMGGVEIKN